MIDILMSFVEVLKGLLSFITDFFKSLLTIYSLLAQCSAYLQSIIFIVPGELLIFGVVFMLIFIFNRLSFGSNGGDS